MSDLMTVRGESSAHQDIWERGYRAGFADEARSRKEIDELRDCLTELRDCGMALTVSDLKRWNAACDRADLLLGRKT